MRERDHLEGIGIDGRIELKWILKLWAWTGLISLMMGTGVGLL
jgi:hypothetical protein